MVHGLSAPVVRSMWDLPGPGLERVSPALAGGFLTTAPPGRYPHPPAVNSEDQLLSRISLWQRKLRVWFAEFQVE